ncbi:MAG: hypothetical protein RIM72_16120 [Alphaproteobacteria bacterium]
MTKHPSVIIKAVEGVVDEIVTSHPMTIHWINDRGKYTEICDLSTTEGADEHLKSMFKDAVERYFDPKTGGEKK